MPAAYLPPWQTSTSSRPEPEMVSVLPLVTPSAARLFFAEYAAETKVFVPTRPICTGADDDVPQSKAA